MRANDSGRSRQDAVGGPSAPISLCHQVSLDSGGARPFCKRPIMSVVYEAYVRPLVISLLHKRCPSTVFWRVGTIVVDSVKAMSWRARSHVAHERREITVPPVAYGDTSTTVAGPCVMGRIRAASLHRPPHVMGLGSGLSMSSEPLRRQFPLSTPAALRKVPIQVDPKHLSGIAAQALADPSGMFPESLSSLRSAHHGQASKRLSGQVDCLGLHGRNYTTNAHTYTPGVTT